MLIQHTQVTINVKQIKVRLKLCKVIINDINMYNYAKVHSATMICTHISKFCYIQLSGINKVTCDINTLYWTQEYNTEIIKRHNN